MTATSASSAGASAGPLGLLGGAFDPVHNGHLRLALEMREHLALAQVRLLPLCAARHRPAPVAPAALRMEMLEAAIAGEPGFSVDDREIRRGGVSYTIDTLESLRADMPDRSFVWIIGLDAFAQLPGWVRAQDLWRHTHFGVARRPGAQLPDDPRLDALRDRAEGVGAAAIAARPAGLAAFVDIPLLDISATGVRARLARGASVRGLVPESVLAIIQRTDLYRHDL
ncbi:MAG: nicotinate-nucleotide adenylyltransferase [Gammaproteobacteria bacterium]